MPDGESSPYRLCKQLEAQITSTLSTLDLPELARDLQKIVRELKHTIVDARLDVQDYELAETREMQLKNAKESKERLEQVRQGILAASEHNVFSAIDVAELGAKIEQIIGNLR
jgi:Sec-independent protein translocase protein TatA